MEAKPSAAATVAIDTSSNVATVGGHYLELTALERVTLAAIFLRTGPITMLELEAAVYDKARLHPKSNVLQVIVSRLRKKLAHAGAAGTIKSVRGIGYRWVAVKGGAS